MDERKARLVPPALIMAARRAFDAQVRAAVPEPFGLVGDSRPLPVFVGSSQFSGAAGSAAKATFLGELTSISLCYGSPDDPSLPYVEVLTDFTPDRRDTVHLRTALGRAARSADMARPPDHSARRDRPPKGPLARGLLEIVVVDRPRTIATMSYQKYNGLQFSHSGKTVTAITRGHWPDPTVFAVILDLEPYLSR